MTDTENVFDGFALFYHRECFRLYKRCFRVGAGNSGKE